VTPVRRALTGAAVVAALVLVLSGCGRGGDSATEAFCDDYRQVTDDLEGVAPANADAADEGLRKLDALDPPEEIKDEFEQIVELVRKANDMAKNVDLNDPAQVSQAQQAFADQEEELAAASAKVGDFLSVNCGIDPQGSGDGGD
jgi:23S rRNA A2030 N6-methylase RlmJ